MNEEVQRRCLRLEREEYLKVDTNCVVWITSVHYNITITQQHRDKEKVFEFTEEDKKFLSSIADGSVPIIGKYICMCA